MKRRIGKRGEVVIPKALRDRLGLHPGTQVEFGTAGDAVVMSVVDAQLAQLRGSLADLGLVEALERDRAREPR